MIYKYSKIIMNIYSYLILFEFISVLQQYVLSTVTIHLLPNFYCKKKKKKIIKNHQCKINLFLVYHFLYKILFF
jgi:hypothetical protein